jgi:nitrogen fixation/metabolism regulation signal transduction histidine kinase
MDKPPPLILLQNNGYRLLSATPRVDDPHRFIAERQDKLARVGEGDLDVAVGFAHHDDEIGDLGRTFNHMVQQLRENREGVEHVHCAQMSRPNAWPQSENLLRGGLTKSAICSLVLQE